MVNWWLFSYRLLKHFLVWLGIILPLQLSGAIILLPLLAFYNNTKPLPRIFRWFDNVDQFIGRNTNVYMEVAKSGWWNKYVWLAWRNPLNYFGYIVLGTRWITSIKKLTDYKRFDLETLEMPVSSLEVGDKSLPGIYYLECELDGKLRYEYYIIHKWSESKCLRVRIGWKLGQFEKISKNRISQWVFVISPNHSYTGA